MTVLALQFLTDVALAALAILVAILAIYLSVKLLGKLAKFFLALVAIVLVLWFIFSGNAFLREYSGCLPLVFF